MRAPAPRPMKATAGSLPIRGEWWYEIKWDGMRLIVDATGEATSLWSANGNDVTVSFPELADLGAALGVERVVLDGEVVVFDDRGVPSFNALQHRMHITNPRQAAERAASHPAVLLLFDVLALDGHDVIDLPLTRRRQLLENLVDGPGPHWQVPAVHDDGEALLVAVRDAGMEGIVAKRTDSTYRPGTRTTQWVKVKVRRRQEFVVGGWAPGKGRRDGTIGGLLLGYHPVDDDGTVQPHLHFAGRVGSGLGDRELRALGERFDELATEVCPFDPAPAPTLVPGARWLRPDTVVEVAFAEWTPDGQLRHPTYAGRRHDVDPDRVTRSP